MRGKHEKLPQQKLRELAKKIKTLAVEIFKAVIAALIANAITKLFFGA